MVAHALDNSASSTLVLISGDRVLAYALSILRLRCYRVVVIAPDTAHFSVLAHASLSFNWGVDVLYPGGSSTTDNPNPTKYTGGASTRRFGGLPTADGDDHHTLDLSTFKFPGRPQTAHVNGLADSGSDQSDQEFRMPTSRTTMKPRNLPETFSSPLLSREAPPSQAPSLQTPPTRTFATRAVSTDSTLILPPKIYESRAVSPVRDPAQVRVTRATSPIPQPKPDRPVTAFPQSPPTEPVPPTQAEPTRTYATRAVSTDTILVSPLKVYASRAVSPVRPPAAASPIAEVPDCPITNLAQVPLAPPPPPSGDPEPSPPDPATLVVGQEEPPSATKSRRTAFPLFLCVHSRSASEPILAAVASNSKLIEVDEEPINGCACPLPSTDEPPSVYPLSSVSTAYPVAKSTPRPPVATTRSIPAQGPSFETLRRLQSEGCTSPQANMRMDLEKPSRLNPLKPEFIPRAMPWTSSVSASAHEETQNGTPTFGTLPSLTMHHVGFLGLPMTNPTRLELNPLANPSSTVSLYHPRDTQLPADQGTGFKPPAPPLPPQPPLPPAARVAPGPSSAVPPAFKPLVKSLQRWRSREVMRPLQTNVDVGGRATYQLAGVLTFSHYLAIAQEQGLIERGGSASREWIALHPRWVHVPCD